MHNQEKAMLPYIKIWRRGNLSRTVPLHGRVMKNSASSLARMTYQGLELLVGALLLGLPLPDSCFAP
jgi:hypothetical protein